MKSIKQPIYNQPTIVIKSPLDEEKMIFIFMSVSFVLGFLLAFALSVQLHI